MRTRSEPPARRRRSSEDVEQVVAVVERAGLAWRVAQLRPLGVVKG